MGHTTPSLVVLAATRGARHREPKGAYTYRQPRRGRAPETDVDDSSCNKRGLSTNRTTPALE